MAIQKSRAPRSIGDTYWPLPGDKGEATVPGYEPASGQSVDDAAKALGFRVLDRKDRVPRSDVVAVISDSGLRFPCVK